MPMTLWEAQEQLQREQTEALHKVFDAYGEAKEFKLVRPADQMAGEYFDKLPREQRASMQLQQRRERVKDAREAGKVEFEQAGARYADRVEAREKELRGLLFGSALNAPLDVRVAINGKSEEALANLVEQAEESLDDELLQLVLLAAHVKDLPEVRAKCFAASDERDDETGESELGTLYAELVAMPDREELERLRSLGYVERIVPEEPTDMELMSDPKGPPILLR